MTWSISNRYGIYLSDFGKFNPFKLHLDEMRGLSIDCESDNRTHPNDLYEFVISNKSVLSAEKRIHLVITAQRNELPSTMYIMIAKHEKNHKLICCNFYKCCW